MFKFFDKVAKSVSTLFKRILPPRTQKKQDSKPRKDGLIKRTINRIRPSKSSKTKGTTKRIPVGKYSDFEHGWGDRKKTVIQSDGSKQFYKTVDPEEILEEMEQLGKGYVNKHGVLIDKDEFSKLYNFLEDYNQEIEDFKSQAVLNIRELYGDMIADAVEKDMARANLDDPTGFQKGLFDDLVYKDVIRMLDKIPEGADVSEYVSDIIDNAYYNISKRNEMYKENYIKAMFNEYGEHDKTIEIAEMIRDMDTDLFMTTYYNQYSEMNIKEFYKLKDMEKHLSKIKSTLEMLNENKHVIN